MKFVLTCEALPTPISGSAAAVFAMARALAEAGQTVTIQKKEKS